MVHRRCLVGLDNDGLLDLIVLRYMQWDFAEIWCGEHREGYRAHCHPDSIKPISPLVYHNDGDGISPKFPRK
jgi:hypothetical protein